GQVSTSGRVLVDYLECLGRELTRFHLQPDNHNCHQDCHRCDSDDAPPAAPPVSAFLRNARVEKVLRRFPGGDAIPVDVEPNPGGHWLRVPLPFERPFKVTPSPETALVRLMPASGINQALEHHT